MADSPEPDPAVLLRRAAEESGRAPSILNTQPWRWRLGRGRLNLYADRDRQVHSIDPQGRLLILSCGAALQHARVALAYAGQEAQVTRWPDRRQPDLLATIVVTGPHRTNRHDLLDHRAMWKRRTERRPSPAVHIPPEALTALRATADAEGTLLHHVDADGMPVLVAAVRAAQAVETRGEAYQTDLREWTRRDALSGQGVPAETVVAPVARPVPLRDLTSGGETLLHPGFGDDRFAEFLVLATAGDEPADWLRAGEATSAVWLAATDRGLAGSVISDVIEVPNARATLRRVLPGGEYPQLVLRLCVDLQPTPPPATRRRPPSEFIDTEPLD